MPTMIASPHRVKARKPHVCDWCGKRIEKGEEYTVSTLVYDGIYDWHECDRCEPYVREMFAGADSWRIDEGLNGDDFDYFMREKHQDVHEEWRRKAS